MKSGSTGPDKAQRSFMYSSDPPICTTLTIVPFSNSMAAVLESEVSRLEEVSLQKRRIHLPIASCKIKPNRKGLVLQVVPVFTVIRRI